MGQECVCLLFNWEYWRLQKVKMDVEYFSSFLPFLFCRAAEKAHHVKSGWQSAHNFAQRDWKVSIKRNLFPPTCFFSEIKSKTKKMPWITKSSQNVPLTHSSSHRHVEQLLWTYSGVSDGKVKCTMLFKTKGEAVFLVWITCSLDD